MSCFKFYALLFLNVAGLLIIYSNYGFTTYRSSSNPSLNRCGLYGTQPTCATCHSPGVGNLMGSAAVSISGNPSEYTLGTTYSITVIGLQTSPIPAFYGFEMAAVRANNANAGTFTAVAGTNVASQTVSGNSISFIRHSTTSTSGTWTFNWKAPSTNVGDIRFYLAINAADGDGGTDGDYIYTTLFTLAQPCTPTTATLSTNNHATCTDMTSFDLNSLVAPTSSAGTWSGTGVSGGNVFNPASVGAGTYSLAFTTGSGNCTDSALLTETVKIKPTPIIVGSETAVCEGDIKTYTVAAIAGTIYQWTVTGGTILSGGGASDNSITILWTATNGTVDVLQTNP
jgi:hypothetical protein